jgi:MtN3 and saliva related transmembrane protein
MDLATAIGFTAGALTTIAFWPQLRRTWLTRSADDVSLAMLLTFTTGVFLWLVYGLLVHSWPIIVTNVVTFLLTAAILVLKIRLKP